VLHSIPVRPPQQRPHVHETRAPTLVRHPASLTGTSNTPALRLRSEKPARGTASDQDCRYIGEWLGTKLLWGLAVDKAELDALKTFADGPCEETVIDHQSAQ
jgi:hypothetical protein